MKIQIISLFPEVIEPYLRASMLWKASDRGIVNYELVNLRDFGIGARKTVDDTPYGGGDGMLLKPEPVVAAIEAARIEILKRWLSCRHREAKITGNRTLRNWQPGRGGS